MKWLLIALALLTAAIGGAAAGGNTAFACSCGNECDQILPDADVIAEGRIVGWREVGEPSEPGQFQPIAVEVDVRRTYRGTHSGALTVYDRASLMYMDLNRDHAEWFGASGACGSFDEDPTGRYLLAAFNYDTDGTLRMGRPATLYVGDGPSGEAYEWARTFLSDQIGAPAAGSGLVATGPGQHSMPTTAAAIALLSLAPWLWVRGRRR